jgi:inactivated superfamily I helicase
MRAEPVAKLTTDSACHALWSTRSGYVLQTTVDGSVVADKHLSTAEAMEWCDLTKRCGGVVYGRLGDHV